MLYRNIEHFHLNMLNPSNDILKNNSLYKKKTPLFFLSLLLVLDSSQRMNLK
jgi:hypothetical protein